MSSVALCILGECRITVGDVHVTPSSPRLFMLLLYLCVERGKAISRRELAEMLSPGSTASRESTHNLRQLLYRLRQMAVPLSLSSRSVSIDAARVVDSLECFLATSIEERARRLDRSVRILPHYTCQIPAAAEWVDALRDREHNRLRRVLSEDIQVYRRRADWPIVEAVARRALELDPLNETATLCLAEAVARTGSKSLALHLLEQYQREVGALSADLVLPAGMLRKRLSRMEPLGHETPTASLPLIGRGEEMAFVTDTWSRCRLGSFVLLTLVGDKSVGKSRLLEEILAVVRLDGSGAVVSTNSSERDRDRPLALFAEIVRTLLAMPGAAGCDPAALPILRRLTEAPSPTGPIGAAFNQSTYDDAAVRNALSDLLASISDERPLLCVVDNAQDLDAASVAMLRSLASRKATSSVMFILATRPPCHPVDDGTRGEAVVRHLHPLSYDSSRQLLRVLVERSGRPLDDSDAAWCLEVAGGNPGHLELLLGSASLASHDHSVPADILALTDQRLSTLSAQAQHSLQALAVVGDGISSSDLSQVTGLSPYALLSALDELDSAFLIRQADNGLLCRSGLVAERSLRAASPVVMALMHARTAALLAAECPSPDMTATTAWRVAGHWKAAGEPRRARDYLRACWQQAINIGQPTVACEAIRRELENCATTSDSSQLLDDLIGALQAAGELNAASISIRERQALSERIHDSPARRESLAFDRLEAEVFTSSSAPPHVSALVHHMESPTLDTCRKLDAARLLMMAADVLIDPPLAERAATVGRSLVPTAPNSILLQRQIAMIFHTVFGDRSQALAIADEIDDLVSSRERSWAVFVARRNCSLARQLVGRDVDVCYDKLEHDYQECIDASMTTSALQYASHLASILVDDGNISRAMEWIEKAEYLNSAVPVGGNVVEYLSAQVDLALLAGNEVRARYFLDIMQRTTHLYEFGRLKNDLLLYRLRVEQVCNDAAASPGDLCELLRFHSIGKRFGRHDDHMDVLWVALAKEGRTEEASALLRAYLTKHRRERRICKYFLKTRTATDPAWRM